MTSLKETQNHGRAMSSKQKTPLLVHLNPSIPPTSLTSKTFAMSDKGQDDSTEQKPQQVEAPDKTKEKKDEEKGQSKGEQQDQEHDLTTFLSDSQCKDFILLVATITERMRKVIESNFDAHATLDKNLIGDPNLSEDEKINNIDPGKVDVDAHEKEKKALADREKELSAPDVKKLKEDALSNYDEWRSAFMKRVGEAVHQPDQAESQMAEAAKNYEAPPTAQDQTQTALGEKGAKVEQKVPKLENVFPRVKTPLTKLSMAQRRLILHSVLLLLISLERYTARSRVLLIYLTSSLKLGTRALQEEEVKTSQGLLESAQEINADKEAKERADASQQSRKWKTRAAVAAGAAVVGISGGMAAPMVASGVGALMGGLGLGATAAAECKSPYPHSPNILAVPN